ncbi:MAG: hypothetical protein R6U13_06415 [Desulfatiglandaceae bacterium]
MQYVKIGQRVRVTFEGHTKNKKNQQVNLFKVEVAKNVPDSEGLGSGTVAVKEEKAPKGASSSGSSSCSVYGSVSPIPGNGSGSV